ncbi:protein shisa-5-like isoform X2 [Alosa sapidissima]|uniref:protein shisa-5-like isoform X2 n=1 Tax=Alosa sapidissima TaxID=34773 RepID=UPI001C09B397|nr:protein shisa-5-like isoform X2 [Alosa sapidissima]
MLSIVRGTIMLLERWKGLMYVTLDSPAVAPSFPSLLQLVSSDIINFSEDVQDACPNNYSVMWAPEVIPMFLIVTVVVVGVIFIGLIVFCCVCPCCCLYQMCRKPRPVVTSNTHTTVVVNNPVPPQAQRPAPVPAQQYPGYQPVPMQPWSGAPAGYGGHPVPSAPMLEHPYGPGPPPPYQESAFNNQQRGGKRNTYDEH